jgi:hypothetical protein
MPLTRTTLASGLVFTLCGIGGWVFGQEVSNPAFSGNKVIPVIKAEVTGAPTKQVIANVYEVPAGSTVPFTMFWPENGLPKSKECRQKP